MFHFFRRKPVDPRLQAPEEPPRIIDPGEIFPDDALWETPPSPEPVAIWQILTRDGVFYADACTIEIVEGALHLLDADEQVIGSLEPGQWERVSAFRAAEARPAGRIEGPGLDVAA